MAACTALALMASACGKDRDATVESTAVSTTVAASTAPTTASSTGDSATSTADTTTADTATDGSTVDTADTTPTTDAASTGPMFGDAPWPCSAGDGANTDSGSEIGVTKDSITIASGDDAGYAASPGLNHQITDAMKALVAKCNDLGGINGRQITLNYYDAKLFEVGTAIQAACDGGNFMLVGEGWAFDGNQEEARLACALPAVPAYSVSAAFAMGKDVFMAVPNPADEVPAAEYAQVAKLLPDAVKHVGMLVANYSSTQETGAKVAAAAPAYGWGFAETNLEYSIGGEADWTPFVKQLQDAGATAVYWSGTCLPNLQLFAQAAQANGLDVPIITDVNHYEQVCSAVNTDGAMDNVYVRNPYIPFEEADVNSGIKDYLDLVTAAGGDISQLGAQATSSFLLWAQAAADCGGELTRACTLENLKNTHTWTGHGMHAEDDPGGNHPPKCGMLMQLQGTEFKRIAPAERGTFECDDTWIAKLSGLVALDAAKLDANRISQQFTAG